MTTDVPCYTSLEGEGIVSSPAALAYTNGLCYPTEHSGLTQAEGVAGVKTSPSL